VVIHEPDPPTRDNHVVEKRHPDDGGRVGHGACERDVLLARGRVTARVVVHEDEGARSLAQGHPQGVTRRHVQAVDTSRGDAARRSQAVVPVEGQEPQLFVVERGKPRSPPSLDRSTIGQANGGVAGRGLHGAAPELDGGGKPRAFHRPHACSLPELADACTSQARDAAVLLE
jgi:hypothetical protein